MAVNPTVTIGSYVEITTCQINEWMGKKTLNTTRNSKITVSKHFYVQMFLMQMCTKVKTQCLSLPQGGNLLLFLF